MSRRSQSGWASSSRLIVGTPEKLVTRSRSISSSARSGFHLYVSTMRPPVSVAGCSRQLHAVTWNSGVGAMNTGCSGGAGTDVGAGMSPAAIALASAAAVVIAQNIRCMMLCTEPRWVSWAPFGNPVVPDV